MKTSDEYQQSNGGSPQLVLLLGQRSIPKTTLQRQVKGLVEENKLVWNEDTEQDEANLCELCCKDKLYNEINKSLEASILICKGRWS